MKLTMLTQNGQYHRHALGKLLDIKGKENPLGIQTKQQMAQKENKIRLPSVFLTETLFAKRKQKNK